jgi:acyl-CoA synthetase (AMP-forming)/AMP-acid ligase II
MVIGCLKARTVPVNVNYYYTPREIHELLSYIQPRAVIYHRSLGAKFADVLPPPSADLLISIDDGSTASELPGAVSLDGALAQGDSDQGVTPSPDDLLMICTGGTTGRPKGVLWRQSDIYVSSMVGRDHDSAQEIHDSVREAGAPWFAVSPLMHAAGMRIPLGYFNDADATRKTFPQVQGRRVVISGDRASIEKDGTLRLFGRDSLVVNTGGEKVFVEEVEEVMRAHPAVADALVVGRPSERWGEELVALVALRDGAEISHNSLRAHCTSQLARFKAPKEFIFVDHVRRLGNGKADYRWAKSQAAERAMT